MQFFSKDRPIKVKQSLIFQFLICASVLVLFGNTNIFSQTRTWVGGTSTAWGTAANWDGEASIPGNSDDILIPSECTFYPIITADRQTASVTIQVNASLTINDGKFEIKNGTKNLVNSGTVTVNVDGELKVSGTITNNADANLNTSGGSITVDTDGSTNVGTISVSSGTLKFNGRNITNLAGGIINQTGGAFEASDLIVNASSNVNFNTGTFTYKGTLTNSGTVTVSSGIPTIDGLFSNQVGGNLLVNGGTLLFKGNAANENYGTITVSSGTLDLSTNNNDLTVYAGGSLNQSSGAVKIRDLTVDATGSYTFSGTTLDITGNLENSGTVTLNPGTVNVTGNITNNGSGNFTIAGANVTSRGDATSYGTMSISSGSFRLQKTDGTPDKKIKIDGGTFTQSGGTVSTKDMELKNGGIYNQTDGEFQISEEMKIPAGTSFNGTGGTVRFTGNQPGSSEYYGNVQFHNVIIDSGGKLNMDKDKDNNNIKISGNFTNNNPDLDNKKGTVTFNGTTPQTISSASDPPEEKSTFGNMVVSNPSGVTLQTDLGLETSFDYNSGGYLDLDGNILYVNGEIYDGALPVELISFSAVLLENKVQLKWRTETEVSNYGFEILRSTQNDRWDIIGFAEGHGNSNSPKDYSFIDENVTARKYSYRLKQIDTDGKFEYSKVIEVDLGSPMNYDLSQNYPNPFNPSTTIRFSVLESSFINLSIFNSLGEIVKELVKEVKAPGVYTIAFNAKDLPSGTYIYRIQTTDFVQTKKMILLK